MKGFSSLGLKCMRNFSESCAQVAFVRQAAAKIPEFHNWVILDKVLDTKLDGFLTEGWRPGDERVMHVRPGDRTGLAPVPVLRWSVFPLDRVHNIVLLT